ncbi:MAG: DUF192 domain-containing protein [Phycisphaeraceae bacterium]|nr:DUF192 domain-containing protein [Phycisphaeraceae bacterium]
MHRRESHPHRRPALALLLAGALVLLAGAGTGGCATEADASGPRVEIITVRGERFRMEVAADEAAIARGLMERADIPADGGMIFIFPDSALRSFWMKNCLVDIDIAFLDGQGRITALHAMKAEPPRGPGESEDAYSQRLRRYTSGLPAQFALEFRAGTIRRLELRLEERIELDLPRLKRLARSADA